MATKCTDYNFHEIEPHWQSFWEQNRVFRADNTSARPKYYVLDMFPYPSGAGLHIGHPEGYTATDILARYKRARGCNVLHPIGWDAFGLPAEQHAVKTGTHPAANTRNNITNFRRQIKALGFSYDWDREIDTTDPKYYRWTQWIFLQLFRRGLAYVDERPVWWCPELRTVLANEEVVDGKSEVGGFPVERRNLRQWVLRITAYAERLLEDLKEVDWPESTKRMQEAWIGRSEGAEIEFELDGRPRDRLRVFTTRPDTLFGCTYMVLAPEHPLVDSLVTADQRAAVEAYRKTAAAKSDLERTDLAKDKSGVFSGAHAINPVTGLRVPIWIADYVLMGYGTGAIMAVPGHDERDYEFAQRFSLPIVPVIDGGAGQPLPYTGDGRLINSGSFNGLSVRDGAAGIVRELSALGVARATVNYKLRDWLFSRQRYWGEPFPIVWVSPEDYAVAQRQASLPLPPSPVTFSQEGTTYCALPLPESALPLELPPVQSYLPSGTGESPLANEKAWVEIWYNHATGAAVPADQPRPPGSEWLRARRETNTMPQWAGSCWYYLRFLDPHNQAAFASPEALRYWASPDLYVGGAEHAVLHLLYARFWHKVLFDQGLVPQPEPFRKLFHQGIILGEDGEKMSKSRGNVVNPDAIIQSHGTDTLRLYLMFLGPLEAMKPWNPRGIEGVHRFLQRVWREVIGPDGNLHPKIVSAGADAPELSRLLHETVKKVGEDIEGLRFNTAISQMMIFSNALQKASTVRRETVSQFLQLLAPFAPHLAEELWARLGGQGSVMLAPWPTYDASALAASEVKLVFQVNGKYRADQLVPIDTTEEQAVAIARGHPRVAPHLTGKTIRRTIFVPVKILNLVVE
ncbi:MAG: leucine--tRNA ligase [Verrucomicrobia bacterium]|nr:leucine--tRNA ligase [Verrucomicrobiota bacterium]